MIIEFLNINNENKFENHILKVWDNVNFTIDEKDFVIVQKTISTLIILCDEQQNLLI